MDLMYPPHQPKLPGIGLPTELSPRSHSPLTPHFTAASAFISRKEKQKFLRPCSKQLETSGLVLGLAE